MRSPARSAALAGFSGGALLLAFVANGPLLNFYGFIPVALGGLGNNRGAIVGGFVLGLFQQAANFLVGGIFSSVAVFALFIVVLLAAPQGLFGAPGDAEGVMAEAGNPAIAVPASPRGPLRALRGRWPLPSSTVFALALLVPFVGNDYWVLIASRAAIYWVLVSGLNLVVGFAGQLAIGYVALLTLGAYTASVLAAGNVSPPIPPFRRWHRGGVSARSFGVDRRPSRPAAADILLRHHDARLLPPSSRRSRLPGRASPAAGSAWRDRNCPRRSTPHAGFYYLCLGDRGALHLDDAEHRAQPLRPRARRRSRC